MSTYICTHMLFSRLLNRHISFVEHIYFICCSLGRGVVWFFILIIVISFFFFSSRRRHTRFDCDWSSDVCSSDLPKGMVIQSRRDSVAAAGDSTAVTTIIDAPMPDSVFARGREATGVTGGMLDVRSEERRVGKECRCRGSAGH